MCGLTHEKGRRLTPSSGQLDGRATGHVDGVRNLLGLHGYRVLRTFREYVRETRQATHPFARGIENACTG